MCDIVVYWASEVELLCSPILFPWSNRDDEIRQDAAVLFRSLCFPSFDLAVIDSVPYLIDSPGLAVE